MRHMRRRKEEEIAFENAVTVNLQAEHRTAEHEWIFERSANHILDDVWLSGAFQNVSSRLNNIVMLLIIRIASYCSPHRSKTGEGLAWYTDANYIKLPPVSLNEFERIPLMELKRVIRLRLNIDPHHIKTRPMVSHRTPARPTTRIQQLWLGAHFVHTPTCFPLVLSVSKSPCIFRNRTGAGNTL